MKLLHLVGLVGAFTQSALSVPFEGTGQLIFGWTGLHAVDSFKSDYSSSRSKEEGSIMDVLRKDKKFTKLVEILEENSGLKDDLEGNEKMTFFAPTNEAIRKMKERMGQSHEKHGMEQVLRYHMVSNEVKEEQLYDGQTIETEMKCKELNNNKQRIRVFKWKGEILLNMYARIEEKDIEAENGIVQAIDRVLLPPPNLYDTLYLVPTKFSTFLAAVSRVGMERELEESKGRLLFVPPNSAWEHLGFQNLMYLFSEEGEKDLKKVLQYHMSNELLYADQILEKEQWKVPTLLKEEQICLEVTRRQKHGNDFAFGHHEDHKCPSKYIISVNKGEASVTFTDAIAENGNIQLISNVLIPKSVRLPGHE